MNTVYLVATLDTKAQEAMFLQHECETRGLDVRLVDVSMRALAGDRSQAMTTASQQLTATLTAVFAKGNLAGVLAIGGSAGTQIATTAMRALPLGVPKLMVSTVASGQVRPYVSGKDIVMMNAVADLCGLNRVTRTVLGQAAAAIAGMVKAPTVTASDERPLVTATMFGITTPCVQHARGILEAAGYEVLVFPANGDGGRSMEGLIEDGVVAGVLDLTTTEIADEVAGGVLSAGPQRLTAAAKRGIPQVVSVGATDVVNFNELASVPVHLRSRRLHAHNAGVTLMRASLDESRRVGEHIGRKLANSPSTQVLLPLHGVSALDRPGQPFCDDDARHAMFTALRQHTGTTRVLQLNNHINDPAFAEAAAHALLKLMPQRNRDL